MWAIDHTHHAPGQALGQEDVVRLFTLLILCTRPEGAPPLGERNTTAKLRRRSTSHRAKGPGAMGDTTQSILDNLEATRISAADGSAWNGRGSVTDAADRSTINGGSGEERGSTQKPELESIRESDREKSAADRQSSWENATKSDEAGPPAASASRPRPEPISTPSQYKRKVAEADGADEEEDLGWKPPNPVLLSLTLASSMLIEASHFSGDGVVCDQLHAASALLQNVASGLVDGAVRAADEKEEVRERSEVGGRRSQRAQSSELRAQRSEDVRGQRQDVRGQRTSEVRSEVGCRRSGVG